MIYDIIDLDQAKAQANIDHDANDDEIESELIPAACAAVQNYLKSTSIYQPEVDSFGDAVTDSNGDTVYTTDILPEVVQATKMMFAYLWRHRDDNENESFDRGYLPKPVTAILYPIRDPALA